jgi:uncharacterized RDD family membrane protein YckC
MNWNENRMSEISSRHSHSNPPKCASLYKRAAAYLLDVLFLVPYLGGLILLGIAFPALRTAFVGAAHAQALQFLLLTLPVGCWLTAWEISPRGATPGKMLLGLSVEYNHSSRRCASAVLRNSLKLLPWELNHAAMWHVRIGQGVLDATASILIAATWILALTYYLGAACSREKRTPYDWLSGTRVVTVNQLEHASDL